MAFWKWSRTASSNAAADNTINWAEGMAPSAVNYSARAMMARLAEWRASVDRLLAFSESITEVTHDIAGIDVEAERKRLQNFAFAPESDASAASAKKSERAARHRTPEAGQCPAFFFAADRSQRGQPPTTKLKNVTRSASAFSKLEQPV